jgi:hypothetical protein
VLTGEDGQGLMVLIPPDPPDQSWSKDRLRRSGSRRSTRVEAVFLLCQKQS